VGMESMWILKSTQVNTEYWPELRLEVSVRVRVRVSVSVGVRTDIQKPHTTYCI